jgi:hypothetical protein
MVEPVLLNPDAIYDQGGVVLALGIPSATLDRARREGALRYTRKGRRVLFLGRWILNWLEADSRGKAEGESCRA